jgi:hypothetical protein
MIHARFIAPWKPPLSATKRALLLLIAAEAERLATLDPYQAYDETVATFGRRAALIDQYRDFGVPINREWIGRDGNSKQRRRRGLRSLEAAGLIVLVRRNGRTASHVRLTEPGHAAVQRLHKLPVR